MIFKHSLQTQSEGFTDITNEGMNEMHRSGVQNGICVVFCPHTTAGITINERRRP